VKRSNYIFKTLKTYLYLINWIIPRTRARGAGQTNLPIQEEFKQKSFVVIQQRFTIISHKTYI